MISPENRSNSTKARGNQQPSDPSPGGTDRRGRSGFYTLKARVKVRGLAAIDKRTLAARALLDWRAALLADLGGEEAVSAAQLALVEMAARTRLIIEHVDAFLLERSTLLTKRRKLIPLVEQRQRLVDSLARLLGQLGLERRAKIIDLARALTETGTLGAPAPLGGPPRGRPVVRRRIPRGNPPPTLNTEPSGRLERRAGSPEVPDAS